MKRARESVRERDSDSDVGWEDTGVVVKKTRYQKGSSQTSNSFLENTRVRTEQSAHLVTTGCGGEKLEDAGYLWVEDESCC
jgi:hypothetical protein